MRKPRPVLRYLGGKWKLAEWIISYFPSHRIYTEAFGGAASVLMQKTPSFGEVYNDLDSEIVNVFQVLRDPTLADRLRTQIELTPFARTEFDDTYEGRGECDDPVERARRTIARAKMGYGSDSYNAKRKSGFRASANRNGTLPSHDWRNYPREIVGFVERLRGVIIENRDALDTIKYHDRADALHYVDPPYVARTRGRSQRYRHELDDEGHRELATLLNSVRGMVVLSGYYFDSKGNIVNPLYDELYPGWQRIDYQTFADGALPKTESLWLSPSTSANIQPRLIA
ncbi:MAG TPA: DNA adenine methylase [Candidatus Baltobacteraceae bacterium]|nr:DNA adenine methylase [Candidatus Baltobacteraceae bacterium]